MNKWMTTGNKHKKSKRKKIDEDEPKYFKIF